MSLVSFSLGLLLFNGFAVLPLRTSLTALGEGAGVLPVFRANIRSFSKLKTDIFRRAGRGTVASTRKVNANHQFSLTDTTRTTENNYRRLLQVVRSGLSALHKPDDSTFEMECLAMVSIRLRTICGMLVLACLASRGMAVELRNTVGEREVVREVSFVQPPELTAPSVGR